MRGQSSVEFFLVISFLLVLTGIIVSMTTLKAGELKELASFSSAKLALNSLSSAIDSVYLQGNGAKASLNVYFGDKPCFSTACAPEWKAFCCPYGDDLVYPDKKPLVLSVDGGSLDVSASCHFPGKAGVVVSNNGGSQVVLSCS